MHQGASSGQGYCCVAVDGTGTLDSNATTSAATAKQQEESCAAALSVQLQQAIERRYDTVVV